MKRMFYHLHDFRDEGVEALPYLACITRPLVLWSPSGTYINDLHKKERAVLGTKGIIEALEMDDPPIRIIGREHWFDKKMREAKKYARPFCDWTDEFDGRLYKMAIEDLKKSVSQRRVIIAQPERGWDLAEERLAQADGPGLEEKLNLMFKEGNVPSALQEKARDAEAKGKSVAQSILRDVFNHNSAVAESASLGKHVDPTFLNLENAIGLDVEIEQAEPNQGFATDEDIRQALLLVQDLSVSLPKNEKACLKFIVDCQRKHQQSLYGAHPGTSLKMHVAARLHEALQQDPLIMRVFDLQGPINSTLTVGGLTALATSVLFTQALPFGVVALGVKILKPILEQKSVLPAPRGQAAKDLRGVYMLRFGNAHPTLRQIRTLLSELTGYRN